MAKQPLQQPSLNDTVADAASVKAARGSGLMAASVQVFGCRHGETILTLGGPASEKRQGTKSWVWGADGAAGAALATAVNDWQIAEWTGKDSRLKGSIVVANEDSPAAAAEIRKRSGDRNSCRCCY